MATKRLSLEDVDAKFEKKLEAMDQKFEKRLEAMDQRIEAMDAKFDKKFDRLENTLIEFMDFVREHVAMKSDVDALNHRMSVLEDHQVRMMEKMDAELAAPTYRMDRFERRLSTVEKKVGIKA